MSLMWATKKTLKKHCWKMTWLVPFGCCDVAGAPALTCYLSMVCVGIDVSILSRAASNREPVVDLDLSSHWPSDL